MKTKCPCGRCTWSYEPADGTRCVRCGRTFTTWLNGQRDWVPDPAVVAVERMHAAGQEHFRNLHRQIARLNAMVLDLRKHTPSWRKAQRRKAARRKERESK